MEKYSDKFTNEYEANKLQVNKLLAAPSKKLRNRIAGYVTRLKVIEAQKTTMMQMSPEAQLGLGEEEEEQSQEQDTPAAA